MKKKYIKKWRVNIVKKKVLMRTVFSSLLKWSQAAILCGPFSGLLSPVSISPAL